MVLNEARALLARRFGGSARITQLAVDFDAKPITVLAVVIAPRAQRESRAALQAALEKRLRRPVTLQMDQVLMASAGNTLEAQRAQLQASADAEAARAEGAHVATTLAGAAGVSPNAVTVDRDHKRATVAAAPLPGADLDTYRALESRAAGSRMHGEGGDPRERNEETLDYFRYDAAGVDLDPLGLSPP